jgi:hypothetical protein
MIRIYTISGCAVCCDPNPGVLHGLEAEFLYKSKVS